MVLWFAVRSSAASFNVGIAKWDVSSPAVMPSMFSSATSFNVGIVKRGHYA